MIFTSRSLKPIIIGIAGGSASGKTTLALKIKSLLQYKVLNESQHKLADNNKVTLLAGAVD